MRGLDLRRAVAMSRASGPEKRLPQEKVMTTAKADAPRDGVVADDRAVLRASASDAARVPALRDAPVPDAPDPAPKRRWVLGGGAVILAVGLALVLYWQPWAARAKVVATETAVPAPVTRVLAVNGRMASLRSVDVRAVVGGTLAALLVAEGNQVRQGDDLAQIDPAGQLAVVRSAVAGLDAALVGQDQAAADYARTQALGSNVARSVLETSARAVQSAAQEVRRATALVDQAQIVLQNHRVRAPMAGTVLKVQADQGQIVDAATVLLTLADLGQLVVETDVDEAYATQITTGLPAVLQLSGEAKTRSGHVSFVSGRVDASTGGLAVKIGFDAAVTAPVGLTVTANIVVDQQAAAITVPRAALVQGTGSATVFVVAGGVARLRPVSVVDWPATRLIVTKGLAAGDVVILDATGISDGLAVTVAKR